MTSDDDDLLLGRDSAVITPSRARMKFIEFLRNFRTHPDQVSMDGRVIYRDVLEDDVLPPTIDGTFLCARFFFRDCVLVLTFRCVLWFDRCRVLISAVVR